MDMRRLTITKPIFIQSPLKRPLTCITGMLQKQHQIHPQAPPPPPVLQPQTNPKALNESLLKRVSSILSNPSLDFAKCKELAPHLSPLEFDSCFLALRSNVNPKTALNFFHFVSENCKFRFTARSYCVLIRLLVGNDLLSPARLLLIRLIDGKVPAFFAGNFESRHFEIAQIMADLNLVFEPVIGVKIADLLVHVYSTQFKHLGFGFAADVFSLLAKRGFASLTKDLHFFVELFSEG
ncbi:hypothetical protein OIU76_004199 [Salix suchowensis]|nr:hypothetical protein OIU76_004199 [Salix suchowensis]